VRLEPLQIDGLGRPANFRFKTLSQAYHTPSAMGMLDRVISKRRCLEKARHFAYGGIVLRASSRYA